MFFKIGVLKLKVRTDIDSSWSLTYLLRIAGVQPKVCGLDRGAAQ